MAGKQKNTNGRGDEGKNKNALVQNSNPRVFSCKNYHTCKESILGQREQLRAKSLSDFRCDNVDTCKENILGQREQLGAKLLSDLSHNIHDTCKESILGQMEQLGAKILSTINEIESDGVKSKLTLDPFMHMVCGKDGRWAIVWSEVNEVGPKVVQPIKPTGHNFIPPSPFYTAKPKSVWRPRQSQTLVNPAHSQSLKSELVAQSMSVLGSQVMKPMENTLPLERQVGVSSSGVGMMPMSLW